MTQSMDELISAEHHRSVQSFMNTEDIKYGYCTEFMVRLDLKKIEIKIFLKKSFVKI